MPETGTLIDADDLRGMFAIKSDIEDPQLERAIVAGSRRLRSWVGDDAYDDALSETPTNELRRDELEYAEGHLAMYFAILGLNTPIRQEGIVRTEKVEGDAVVTYLSPDETTKVRQAYLEQAETLAREYLLSDGTPSSPFAVTDLC